MKPEWVKERKEFSPQLWEKLVRINKRHNNSLLYIVRKIFQKWIWDSQDFFPPNSWKKGYEMSLHRPPHCPMQDEAQVLRSGPSVQHWDACEGVGSMYLFFLQQDREKT